MRFTDIDMNFDITYDGLVPMFDFMMFDIYLTFWHMKYNLNHISPSQGYFIN